jgi:CheY-like chemotaxis protein/anti-sigma regulatory factor (Ser/Thr protein kinase)
MPRLLLVEDNEMNRDMLTRRLERKGYHVMVAIDGAEAIAKARGELPQVILMDMSLPVLDGWEAARRLKEDAATRRIPVIALTAHAMAGDREKALAAGCDDFDTKPIDLQRLLGKIEHQLGRVNVPDAVAGKPETETPLALTCRASLQSLPALHALADTACSRARAGQEDAFAIRLAVEEVFSNIVHHGYPAGQPGQVTVTFAVEPWGLRITVQDDAAPFDPAQALKPDLAADAQARPIGGLGWHLVFRLMDEVTHEVLGVRGNRLVLVKRFTNIPRSTE